MTQFLKITCAAFALTMFVGTQAFANEITGFGASFMNKAPAALGEVESDPVVAAEDDVIFDPEELNEIAPAAGGDVIHPDVQKEPETTVPAVQQEPRAVTETKDVIAE